MIKVENKSRKEIADIGRRIGEAFADEKAGTVTMLTREQTIKGFEIMTEWFLQSRNSVYHIGNRRGIPCLLE